jgi:hypothetical protein
MFVPAKVMKRIIAATTLAIAAWTTPVFLLIRHSRGWRLI